MSICRESDGRAGRAGKGRRPWKVAGEDAEIKDPRIRTLSAPDLAHFVEAQARVYDRVVQELTTGRKQSHWMWFIFPQLAGLGSSPTSRHFAIRDLNHARRYLDDPVLGPREVEKIDQVAEFG